MWHETSGPLTSLFLFQGSLWTGTFCFRKILLLPSRLCLCARGNGKSYPSSNDEYRCFRMLFWSNVVRLGSSPAHRTWAKAIAKRLQSDSPNWCWTLMSWISKSRSLVCKMTASCSFSFVRAGLCHASWEAVIDINNAWWAVDIWGAHPVFSADVDHLDEVLWLRSPYLFFRKKNRPACVKCCLRSKVLTALMCLSVSQSPFTSLLLSTSFRHSSTIQGLIFFCFVLRSLSTSIASCFVFPAWSRLLLRWLGVEQAFEDSRESMVGNDWLLVFRVITILPFLLNFFLLSLSLFW